MKELLKTLLVIGAVLLADLLIFCVVVLIAGTVNQVGFYDQLCLWFGHGSAFAGIFGN